jgi:hypothetical protein
MSWSEANVVEDVKPTDTWSDADVVASRKPLASVKNASKPMSPLQKAADFGAGLLEVPAAMLTGTAADIYGGLKGGASLLTGKGTTRQNLETAVEDINKSKGLAYQPRTETGKYITGKIGGALDYANEKLGMLGGYIGESINGEQGRNVGEEVGKVALPLAGTAFGGSSLLKSAGKVQASKAQLQAQVDPYLDIQKGIKKAGNDIGLIAPAESGFKRTVSKFGGADAVLSFKNTEVATGKLAEQIGMKAGAISDNALSARIGELTQDYANVQKTLPPKVMITPQFKADVDRILIPMKERFAQDPEAFSGYAGSIKLLEQQLRQTDITPSILMDKIKKLRSDARTAYKKTDLSTVEKDLAASSIDLANMYEDLVEAQLGNKTALLNKFRDSRTKLSQINIIDQARKADGLIDLQKLSGVVGKYAANKKMVTGNLKTIADFSNTYKTVTQPTEQSKFGTIGRFEGAVDTGALVGAMPSGGLSLLALTPTVSRAVVPSMAKRGWLQTQPPSYTGTALRQNAGNIAQGAVPLSTNSMLNEEDMRNFIEGNNQ